MGHSNHKFTAGRSVIFRSHSFLLYFYLGSNKLYQGEIKMKEYTVLSVISVLLTVLADKFSGIRILKRPEFYVFIIVILLFKLIVNGYLTGNDIVMYNHKFFLGIRFGSIPLEDFLFGFSMVTLTIILWEFFKRKGK